MSASNYLENAALDKTFRNVDYAVVTVYLSLHSADPGETGANEIVGGSYARQSSSWNVASGGQTDNGADVLWTGMPAATVVAVGAWDALSGGNFLGYGWLGQGGFIPRSFVAIDPTNDIFTAPSHGYLGDDVVVFDEEIVGPLPSGVTAGTQYFILSPTTDMFKITLTGGGAGTPVNYTGTGSGHVIQIFPAVIPSGDSVLLSAAAGIVRLF